MLPKMGTYLPGFSVSLLGVATTQENYTKVVKVFEI